MSKHSWRALSLLVAASLVPAAARAQEGLGLDLSEAPNPDFRPALAVLGVGFEPPAQPGPKLGMDRLGGALVVGATAVNSFRTIAGPDEIQPTLGEGYAAAARCDEAECLGELATTLDVDRIVTAQYSDAGQGGVLKLTGYDRGSSALATAVLDTPDGKTVPFQKRVAAAYRELLGKLATPLAILKVKTNAPQALVIISGRHLGAAPLEKAVPAGKVLLRVTHGDYLPFEIEKELPSKQIVEVEVTLLPRPEAPHVEVVKPRSESGPSFLRAPTFVAAAGVVALAVGAGFGLSAKGVESRARDSNGDGILEVTRLETQHAKRNATLATVLIAGGAALLAGGALWFVLVPEAPVNAPDRREPVAFALVGGSF